MQIVDDCYAWDPRSEQQWTPDSNLISPAWAFVVAQGPDLDLGADERVPIELGFGSTTQVKKAFPQAERSPTNSILQPNRSMTQRQGPGGSTETWMRPSGCR